MSNLENMALAYDEILKNMIANKNSLSDQSESISEFKDILLTATNKIYLEDESKDFDEVKKIFVVGAGRSGFVARSFAMRLMHLGFFVYVMGETIAPPVDEGDIILSISKSGKSNSTLSVVEAMKNVKQLVVYGNSDSPLAKKADAKIFIQSLPQKSTDCGELILMGTAFELGALVMLDALVVDLMHELNLTEEDLKKRHANLGSNI